MKEKCSYKCYFFTWIKTINKYLQPLKNKIIDYDLYLYIDLIKNIIDQLFIFLNDNFKFFSVFDCVEFAFFCESLWQNSVNLCFLNMWNFLLMSSQILSIWWNWFSSHHTIYFQFWQKIMMHMQQHLNSVLILSKKLCEAFN